MLKFDDGGGRLIDVASETVQNEYGQIEYNQPDQVYTDGGNFNFQPPVYTQNPLPTLVDERQNINPQFENTLTNNMLISTQPQIQPPLVTNTQTVYETIANLNAKNDDVLGVETSVLNSGLEIKSIDWKTYLSWILAIIAILLTVYQLTKSKK